MEKCCGDIVAKGGINAHRAVVDLDRGASILPGHTNGLITLLEVRILVEDQVHRQPVYFLFGASVSETMVWTFRIMARWSHF